MKRTLLVATLTLVLSGMPALAGPVVVPDSDGDGVIDTEDNCIDVINPAQDDTDGDDCGNLCDADYDNSGLVAFADFFQFSTAFNTGDEEKCHIESIPGCTVGFSQFFFFSTAFGGTPGPSGTTAGTTACP